MNFIIDFEFNGLPRYEFVPEITQAKIKNLTTGKTVCQNYISVNPGFLRGFYGENTNGAETIFSKEEFEKLLNLVGASYEDTFIGFSTKTDKQLLENYGIVLEEYKDCQEALMLTEHEAEMAYGGRSLEACYYIVTGEVVTDNLHNSAEELDLIEAIYNASTEDKRNKKFLTMVPYGPDAGMPIIDYCIYNRNRVDGYRYNNEDVYASSLDFYCKVIDFAEIYDVNLSEAEERILTYNYRLPRRAVAVVENNIIDDVDDDVDDDEEVEE